MTKGVSRTCGPVDQFVKAIYEEVFFMKGSPDEFKFVHAVKVGEDLLGVC